MLTRNERFQKIIAALNEIGEEIVEISPARGVGDGVFINLASEPLCLTIRKNESAAAGVEAAGVEALARGISKAVRASGVSDLLA